MESSKFRSPPRRSAGDLRRRSLPVVRRFRRRTPSLLRRHLPCATKKDERMTEHRSVISRVRLPVTRSGTLVFVTSCDVNEIINLRDGGHVRKPQPLLRHSRGMESEGVSPTPLNDSRGNGTAQSSHSVDHDLHVILSLSVAFAVGGKEKIKPIFKFLIEFF